MSLPQIVSIKNPSWAAEKILILYVPKTKHVYLNTQSPLANWFRFYFNVVLTGIGFELKNTPTYNAGYIRVYRNTWD